MAKSESVLEDIGNLLLDMGKLAVATFVFDNVVNGSSLGLPLRL